MTIVHSHDYLYNNFETIVAFSNMDLKKYIHIIMHYDVITTKAQQL